MINAPRVLVVDDEESIRITLRKFLEGASCQVHLAETITDAEAIIATTEVDVAVIDRLLASENGLDLAGRIKARQPLCQVIMISASPFSKPAAGTPCYEVFAHINKPITKKAILKVTEDAVNYSRAVRDEFYHEALFRSLFNSSPDAIAIYDMEGNAKFVNDSFTRIFGYDKAEALDRALPYGSDSDMAATLQEMLDSQSEGHVAQWEAVKWTKDGRELTVAISLSVCHGSQGRPTDALAIMRDVTEARRLERRLHQMQKMEAIGNLAGGIAHDFNNILSVIIGGTELALQEAITSGSEQRVVLNQVLEAGLRARDVVHQILTFSRRVEQNRRPVHLGPVVEESLKMLRASLPAGTAIEHHFAPHIKPVLADPIQIQQVIANLGTNACYAMRSFGGTMKVTMDMVDTVPESGYGSESVKQGPYLRIAVEDTGQGMDLHTMERIFEPFYTSRRHGEGTGLGLSVVLGIVRSHGGRITVTSDVGRGTTFEIYLPTFDGTVMNNCEKAGPLPRGMERILLVDDEPSLVGVTKNMLERFGYEVYGYSVSREALDAIERDPGRWDLVMTDLSMPSPTGLDMVREIRRIRPDLPVILITGLGEAAAYEDIDRSGFADTLIKPFVLRTLAETVRRALDSHGDRQGKDPDEV